MKERGIIKEVTIGWNGMIILAFCVSVLWSIAALVSAIDGTLLIGGDVQSTHQLLMMVSLQSAVAFAAVLLVWLLWDVIVAVVWLISLFARN